ncbi:hypothetical protein [Kordia zhangzhouensis]|uniref:hypothetical protein n=1 Tax=Kordia zhangzhouensis TaxID=1620405 RepID=UPI000629BA71|nr:hypothetical protein [Kordia zhangzhouensis]
MKAAIINTNYFKETKWYRIWRLIVIVGFVLFALDRLAEQFYETYQTPTYFSFIDITFVIVFIIGFILEYTLFIRVGMLKLVGNVLIIDQEENEQHINLTQVKKVKIQKTHHGFYIFEIDNVSLTVELTKEELNNLKAIFQKYRISVSHRRFL